MPRVGVVWDPTGARRLVDALELRPLLRPVPERRRHGLAGADQLDPVGAVQPVQRRRAELPEPVRRTRLSGAEHLRPPVDGVRASTRTPSRRTRRTGTSSVAARRCSTRYLLEVALCRRARAATCRATSKTNPAVFGPGATAQNADRRRIYANCPPTAAPATSRRSRCCRYITHSNYHAGQVSVSRRYSAGRRVQRVVLAFEVDRRAVVDEPVGRGREAARGRERPRAEPVRPRRRVRSVAVRRAAPVRRERELGAARAGQRVRPRCGDLRRLAAERHRHASTRGRRSRSPTRPTSSLQANSPPISGFAASRPNLVGDPNAGPHTVDAWLSRVGVPAAESADPGRPVRQRRPQHRARARLRERRRLAGAQLRASTATRACSSRSKSFNVANHREPRAPGRRSQLGQLRAHSLGRPAAADAVRGQADVLKRGSRRTKRCGLRTGWRVVAGVGARRVRQLRVTAGLHVRHLPQAARRGIRAGRGRRFGGVRHRRDDGRRRVRQPSAICSIASVRRRVIVPCLAVFGVRVRVAVAADAASLAPVRDLLVARASSATARRRWRTRARFRAGSLLRRGMALAVVMSGGALGAMVLPPVAEGAHPALRLARRLPRARRHGDRDWRAVRGARSSASSPRMFARACKPAASSTERRSVSAAVARVLDSRRRAVLSARSRRTAPLRTWRRF